LLFLLYLSIYSAKLTKVCRYKDFYLFIFPSANIIVRAKALKLQAIHKAFALTGRLADCYYTQGDALG
ncbi:hypothetical protein, partial [Segatella sp.]